MQTLFGIIDIGAEIMQTVTIVKWSDAILQANFMLMLGYEQEFQQNMEP